VAKIQFNLIHYNKDYSFESTMLKKIKNLHDKHFFVVNGITKNVTNEKLTNSALKWMT